MKVDMAPIMVRPYGSGDLGAVGRVHANSRWAAYDGLVPAEALATVTPETQTEFWRERMSLPASSAFVAERDGEVVGFVALLETEEGTELSAIHVLPHVVGTGVGSALMKAAVEHTRAHGSEALHLLVIEGNERARNFYTRTGWRLTGTVGMHELGGTQVEIVRYELRL